MSARDLSGIGGLIINKEEGLAHNFDLFSGGILEKAMKKGYDQQIYPTSFNSSEGPFEFYIPGSNNFLFFPHTRLYVRAQIVKVGDDGLVVNATGADAYSVANLFPQTLFKQVDVEVGGVNTSSQDQLYAYKSYMETLLSYGQSGICTETFVEGHLASTSHYYLDEPGHFDDADSDGCQKRRPLVRASSVFDFCIPLHADIMHSVRALPPNIPVKITLTRNPDSFSVIADAGVEYRIKLLSLKLYIRKIEADESIYKEYITSIQKQPAILPFTRTVMKKYLIAQNSTNTSLSSIFRDHLPRQIVMAIVKQTRVDGRQNENPFNFQPFGINCIQLKIDGQNFPPNPYQPDFERGLISRELRALYDNTGVQTSDGGFTISREGFKNGYTLFAWDLTPDVCNGWHLHAPSGRGIDLDLTFSAPLTTTVNIIFYASFEASLFINKENAVSGFFPS